MEHADFPASGSEERPPTSGGNPGPSSLRRGDDGRRLVDSEPASRDLLSSSLGCVRRRLFLGRLLRAASLDALIFGSLWALALAAERAFSFGIDPLLALAGCSGLWLLVSVSRTAIFGRVDEREAAMATDAGLELEERVSSALYLRDHPGTREDSEWSELVYRDSINVLRDADIQRHFPLRLPRLIWLSAAPLLAATALWIWMPDLDLLGYDADRQADASMRTDIAEAKKDVVDELRKLQAQAPDKESAELRKIIEELRKQMERTALRSSPGSDRVAPSGEWAKRRALTQVSRQIDGIRKRLAGDRRFQDARKALEQTRRAGRDLPQVAGELDELRKHVGRLAEKKDGSPEGLDEKDRKRLDRLSEELRQLARGMKSPRGLGSALSQISTGLSGNDLRQALDGLQLSRQELESLVEDLDRMELLEKTRRALEKAQQKLAKISKHECPNCGKSRSPEPGQKPGGT